MSDYYMKTDESIKFIRQSVEQHTINIMDNTIEYSFFEEDSKDFANCIRATIIPT